MAKQLGRGSKIYYGPTAAGAWTKVPQVDSIGEIVLTSAKTEVTDLESTALEYLPALSDPSTVTVTGFWDPLDATHQAINAAQQAGTSQYFKIEVVRNAVLIRTLIVAGYWSEFGKGPLSNKDPVKFRAVLQMSGAPTES